MFKSQISWTIERKEFQIKKSIWSMQSSDMQKDCFRLRKWFSTALGLWLTCLSDNFLRHTYRVKNITKMLKMVQVFICSSYLKNFSGMLLCRSTPVENHWSTERSKQNVLLQFLLCCWFALKVSIMRKPGFRSVSRLQLKSFTDFSHHFYRVYQQDNKFTN